MDLSQPFGLVGAVSVAGSVRALLDLATLEEQVEVDVEMVSVAWRRWLQLLLRGLSAQPVAS
ncbi:MAG: hypothetical protein U1F98_14725 [Verrucomicrobiota bacterium]